MAFDDTEDAAIPEAAEYTAGEGSPGPQQAPADNSGMGPVEAIPTDNSGMGPVAAGAETPQSPEEAPAYGPLARGARAVRAFPGNAKRIVSYLMGEGADNPALVKQAAITVDPQGQMPPGDANVLAVAKASQQGGEEAAWKLVQANRVAYNAKQAFGYAALNGTPGKPPDLMAAVEAANQAADHVLDGNNVKFMVSQAGQITATVTPPGGQPNVIDLTPDQFRRYLNVGRDGQWDRVMQQSIPGTLQKLLTESPGAKAPPRGRERVMPGSEQQEAISTAPEPETNFGKTPSSINLSGSTKRGPEQKDITNYGPELEARAQKLFPSVSQQAEAQRWMAAQEGQEQERENKLNIAKNTGASRVAVAQEAGSARRDVAGTQGQTQRDVAETKRKGWEYASDAKKAAAQITADQKAAHDGNVDARARIESARKAIATKRMTAGTLSPDDEALEKQLVSQAQAGAPQGQSQAPQRPQAGAPKPAAAPGPGAPPVQGAKFFNGSWYTRGPNGEAVPYKQ